MAKRINRRDFAKLAAGTTLVAPLAPILMWPQEAPKKPDAATPPAKSSEVQTTQPADAPKREPRPRLTAEQEEAVKKAVERRDRQLAALRARVLPYNAEPAFVFQVRQRTRVDSKM